MKKFRFSLEALLSYREHNENMARQDVARVQAEINRCNDYIRELSDLEAEAHDEFEMKSMEGVSSAELSFYSAFISGLEHKIQSETELLGNLETLMKKKREELSQRAVQRKVIENLKTKRRQEYYDELDKVTQNESDDTVLMRKQYKQKETDQGE